MRIAFTFDPFLSWQGGIDFADELLSALTISGNPGDRIDVLVANAHDSLGWRIGRVIKGLATGQSTFDWMRGELARKSKLRSIRSLVGRKARTRLYTPSQAADLRKLALRYDVVGPTTRPLESPWRSRWLGYIPDVQHRKLPQLFSTQEIKDRDALFQDLLDSSRVLITNAQTVREDLNQYFSVNECKIVVLPFSACPEPEWFIDNDDLRHVYNIDRPYFICSNQFWKHKNHKVILEAINLAKRRSIEIPYFVFTGATQDYRHPSHFSDLRRYITGTGIGAHVRILGQIPKSHHIQLLRKALAVVQPTLFEGGPGGGAVSTAIALGQRTIVSDIPVNRLVASEVTAFFDPYSSEDLLRAVRGMESLSPPLVNVVTLIQKGLERRRRRGAVLRSAFELAAG